MLKDLKRASFKHKNNKAFYYIRNYCRLWLPSGFIPRKSFLKYTDDPEVIERVNYYNRLSADTPLAGDALRIMDFKLKDHRKVYYFDTYEYIRFFDKELRFSPLYGDVTHIPDHPSLTKSRPIEGDNANSVLLNMDKIRHFLFLKDKNRFCDKKDMLVGRSKAGQPHRIKFLEMYFNHPMCDIGQVNRDKNIHFIAPRLTIEEHLKYKFILCLEGNDVASNLKWVMSSNSLAVMPRPKYETWFMEGTLIPDHHYVCIKDDYSDLEEKMNYYIGHTDEALSIIDNAHRYIDRFRDQKKEDAVSMLVLEKYFRMTGQT